MILYDVRIRDTRPTFSERGSSGAGGVSPVRDSAANPEREEETGWSDFQEEAEIKTEREIKPVPGATGESCLENHMSQHNRRMYLGNGSANKLSLSDLFVIFMRETFESIFFHDI